MNIVQRPSPNFTIGRQGATVDRIVIHWMDGFMAAADSVFANAVNQTSAHYGIEGTTIHQYVDEANTAYHAGDWSMNLRSIGIEHSAQPGRDASEDTYQTSGKLIANICARHNIPIDREHIIKHSEVIPTACPGTVDLDKLIAIAKGEADMRADLSMVRQMAQTVGGRVGRNGFPDTNGADLPSHVGTDAGQEFLNWYWSQEGVTWRDHVLPTVLNTWQKYKDLGPELEKQVAAITAENAQLKAQPSADTALLNEGGNFFTKLWDRLRLVNKNQ